MQICVNYSKYVNPINIYIKKIFDIMKSHSILFINDLRDIIYKLHLLNYDPYKTIGKYIDYCIKMNTYTHDEIKQMIEIASNLDKNEPYNKYFFSIEYFFISVKNIKYKI